MGIRDSPEETNLYYLKTRYYDPEIGRFITIDDLSYLDPETINGLNLYAYCGNNPVMRVDPNGNLSWLFLVALFLFTPASGVVLQTVASALSYVGMAVASIFDEDIRNDMNTIGWNPFNSDASLAAASNKVSFYKGVPVFRTDGSSSGAFGVILLCREGFTSNGFYWSTEEILKHERGHVVQHMTYGTLPYLINIGIPSALIKDCNYDDAPWEIMADVFGGVVRPYNSNDIKQGWKYFYLSKLIIPFWWWKKKESL